MTQDMRPSARKLFSKTQLRQVASPILLGALLTACASNSEPAIDAAAPAASQFAVSNTSSQSAEDFLALATYWGGLYDASPGDRDAALNFGRALRHLGRHNQSINVLKDAVQRHPDDPEILAEYGKILTSTGQALEGSQYLAQANARKPGNWTNLSAEGVALSAAGSRSLAQDAG